MKNMNEHKIVQRAKQLWVSIEGDEMTKNQWNKYETLDKEFKQAVQFVDNKCRKLFPPHNIEFLPEVKEAIGNLTKWKEIEKKRNKKPREDG